jgi:hypothetical protein
MRLKHVVVVVCSMALGMLLAAELQLSLSDYFPSSACLEAVRRHGPIIGENPCAPRTYPVITALGGTVTAAFVLVVHRLMSNRRAGLRVTAHR